MTENLEPPPSLAELAHRICEINAEVIEDMQSVPMNSTVREALTAILELNTDYIRRLTESYLGVGDKIHEIATKYAPKKS